MLVRTKNPPEANDRIILNIIGTIEQNQFPGIYESIHGKSGK